MINVYPPDLWARVETRVREVCSLSLRPVQLLGRPRPNRCTWLAEGGPETVIVKAVSNPFALKRLTWTEQALSILKKRGYPIARTLWRGALDEQWLIMVQARVPGEAIKILDASALDALFALVDLQADPGITAGSWDISWWMSVVLFEGWEGWWKTVQTCAPETGHKLRSFVQPAWGLRLPADDLVHGDLNLTNVLCDQGTISGVVDWDDVGIGSRASDLTSLLFDWHRLRLSKQSAAVPDGGERLVRRIIELVGIEGLRCTITYGAIARIALTAERGEQEALSTWRQVAAAIVDFAI